jgi:hypothetical protein
LIGCLLVFRGRSLLNEHPLVAGPCNCPNQTRQLTGEKQAVGEQFDWDFNRGHIYSVERLKYSLDRLQKRNTNCRAKAMEHRHTEGVSVRGLPARLEGEKGEHFWFEGGSDADKSEVISGGGDLP